MLEFTLEFDPPVTAICVTVKLSSSSASLSSAINKLSPELLVTVASSLTASVSLTATGASLTAVTFTVIVLGVALSESPSFTVKLKVV